MGRTTVEERLITLERQNRRMKYLCLLAGGILAAAVAAGAARDKRTVDCEELNIRDTAGKVRIKMTVNEQMTAKEQGPCVLLLDSRGNCRLLTAVTDDGATLGLFGAMPKERMLTLTNRGDPQLSFSDTDGNTRGHLVVAKEGMMLVFKDTHGKNRVALLAADQVGRVAVFDDEEKVIWKTP